MRQTATPNRMNKNRKIGNSNNVHNSPDTWAVVLRIMKCFGKDMLLNLVGALAVG